VTGEMALEGGALVLSDMGVCCIDEFDKMEDSERTAIYEVMEQQSVSIAKAGITTTLNARTAILAAANPVYSKYNTKRGLMENVNLPAALLSRFDLLFLLLDKPSIEGDTALANHIAYVHTTGEAPSSNSVGLPALRSHIEKAKSFEPVVRPELSRYIETAYVTMREENTEEPVTPRQLLAVLRLAMALARIRFAQVVEQEDVDEALRLVKASKESVQMTDQDAERRTDVTTAIYDKIMAMATGEETLRISEVRTAVLQSGYTQANLDQTLDTYERLGVWQLNPGRTKLTFLNTGDE
jgi:DNA replication licensing factor MCM7